ncbi:MAG: hypothetical protein Fur0032_04500 [Terrimicrobiaceae bacterium]
MLDEVNSLKKSLKIYRGLVEVSGLIGSITDYDELLRAILDVARRVISAEAASLFFVNPATGCLDLAIASSVEGEFDHKPISVPKGRGIAGWVFEHGKGLLIEDAYADARFYKDADRQTGFRTRSILCAPLKRDGEVMGVLQILNPRDKPAFEQEDLDGFEAYANLTATAIEKLRNLQRLREQERVQRDIAIAAEIQTELLSRAIPPSTPGLLFAAHNSPASNVGGDFYDVFVKGPSEIFFSIGDVSGKGIAASLLMAQTLSAMQFVFASTDSPSDALTRLNNTLSDRIVRGMFVTTLVGRFLPESGVLEIASAGHCQPVVLRANGHPEALEVEPALPLGILPGRTYSRRAFAFSPGDWLIVFTDGLSESQAEKSDLFFDQILHASLEGIRSPSPDRIVQALVQAESSHRGSRPQRDDLTILVGGLAPPA